MLSSARPAPLSFGDWQLLSVILQVRCSTCWC